MRFGRLEKRFNQNTYTNIVDMVERLTGETVDKKERHLITKGGDEIDLVRSGLEETMVSAYEQIYEIFRQKRGVEDLRSAAFISALNKIGNDYINMGIFP